MENVSLDAIIQTDNIHPLSQKRLDTNEIHNSILHIKKTLSEYELQLLQLQKKIASTEKTVKVIKKEHFKVIEKYEVINQTRLDIISRQEKMLRLYRVSHMIKKLFWPKIGVLYQYKPRLFTTPKRYKKNTQLAHVPTVSIVTPSFNQGDFLEKTIKSIIDQKYPSIEYIIQDSASKDGTIEIIHRYKDFLTHWESIKDKGQSNAINLGFRHTSGEIMAYLNSDDILLPGTLHYVADYFNKHPEIDVVYGHRILINEDDHEIGRWILPRHNSDVLTWADYIPQETLFWRRRIWDKVDGKIDESFKFAMDWDLLLRFKDAGAKFARLPRFLGAFRIHIHQKTSAKIASMGAKEMERLRMRCHGRKITPIEIKKNIILYLMEHVVLHKLYKLGIMRY